MNGIDALSTGAQSSLKGKLRQDRKFNQADMNDRLWSTAARKS
jgi:hypothetical protein